MDAEAASCRLCKKKFKSMKSLYGHMRCHQRNWRGVSPPPGSGFSVSDQVLPLKNWSVTAKRGRKAQKPSNANKMADAVTNLLLLANKHSQTETDEQLTLVTSTDNKAEKKIKGLELRQYQCITCSKTFSSHQALGGHRSSHKKIASVEEMDPMSGMENVKRKVCKLLDFDLNEPPKQEDTANITL
ncbi:hypothetical protein J5N97_008091 [Dioscorea zingiberensis]|uniref:C2H2-type domain-containing protein n=1 Tax=Dioscorea zingiberensis TaxID=325984 RepID=A0A9D5DDI1_9LILI|nr:hypothetical protein J5N97_008091 [Dioscorea zingiberensis]